MTFKQKLNEGQIVELNGRDYRIEGGALVPVVQRGPLGGESVKYQDIKAGQRFYIPAYLNHEGFIFTEHDVFIGINKNTIVETNIPPRPTFTPTTAGEAAKLPDIVGRWVVVKVEKIYQQGIESQGALFATTDKILLIEGVDLP